MAVLVIDIGGSNVKLALSPERRVLRRFASGGDLRPECLVHQVRSNTSDWHYDVISIDFPNMTNINKPNTKPDNLKNK